MSDESETLQRVMSDMKLQNGRYTVNLPWKIDNRCLNDNKKIAFARLNSLTSKLLKDFAKLKEYDAGIQELLQFNIAEKVTETKTDWPVYYMPHRPVYREDKSTTKMRIVFDASSKEPGLMSLNEHLSAGDNMVANLLTSLLRFRSNNIAIISDIEKAFLQIAIAEHDRDAQRFLWYESPPQPNERMPKVAEFRMARVTFGVASSPFLLAATIQKHLHSCRSQYGDICEKLEKSFYVDDLVLSVSNLTSAMHVFYKANEIMRAAHFNLRKWNTNSVELKKCFSEAVSDPAVMQKVLGLNWCTTNDEINVDIASSMQFIETLRATKRNVMKAMAKIYDPLGMLGPFTVRIKILLQKIWVTKIDWDQTLNEEMSNEFQSWKEELQDLSYFSIKRCLSSSSQSRCDVHIFADASPMAYGTVAYVRQIKENGEICTNLVCSKNRVRPIEKKSSSSELTLPKLELTAALIAARLKQFLIGALDFEVRSVTLWTFSTIALHWINGRGKQVKPYVKARVEEINTLTNIYDWRHCQGKLNPADLLTRGVKAIPLTNSDLWKYGPPWLSETESDWPKTSVIVDCTNLIANVEETTIEKIHDSILQIQDYSGIKRLLRVTAFILRFIRNAKARRTQRITKSISAVEELTSLELRLAEDYWIKYVQLCYFSQECKALLKGNAISSNSKILSLNPCLVNGVLRLRGRLPESEFGKTLSNPVILPKQSHFSKLIVSEAHHATLHGGVNAVLALIRRRFWIVRGRQLIKGVLQRCIQCKRLHGKGASEQWTTLPAERVATSTPFKTTGVDFAGPLYVQSTNDSNLQKVYILLFTCAAIRAVHLELVRDMTVESCIDALRRFIARRGVPDTIISDNARTFKRADLELRKLELLMKAKEVQQLAAHKGINWKYIPERAAWWGGFWERLIRSVKNALKAAIGKARLTYDELATMLVEVESVVNQRLT